MIPIDSPPLPRYRAFYWNGDEIGNAAGETRSHHLLEVEVTATKVSNLYPDTIVEVWDVLLVCPMAWYQGGKLGWHR